MLKQKLIRFCAYLLPLGIVVFYLRFFGKKGAEGMSCTFFKQTGLFCPGCGGQRSFQALLKGEFIEAFHLNALMYILVPLLLLCYVIIIESYFIKNSKIAQKIQIPPKVGFGLVIVLAVFFILRNIPYKPFIYLIPQ